MRTAIPCAACRYPFVGYDAPLSELLRLPARDGVGGRPKLAEAYNTYAPARLAKASRQKDMQA